MKEGFEMLAETLLDEKQRKTLREAVANTAVPLPGGALTRVFAGLQAYAALRGAHPRNMPIAGAAANIVEDHRAGFDDICGAVAEAVSQLPPDPTGKLARAIPELFRGNKTGVTALRQYWLSLGFPASSVDHYVAEAVNAGDGLVQITRAIQDGSDWPEAIKQFGSGNPDPIHWGSGFSGDGKLHPTAAAFATTCRQAGVMPSLFVIASIALLLHKLATEAAAP
jgi:hypothetical protein